MVAFCVALDTAPPDKQAMMVARMRRTLRPEQIRELEVAAEQLVSLMPRAQQAAARKEPPVSKSADAAAATAAAPQPSSSGADKELMELIEAADDEGGEGGGGGWGGRTDEQRAIRSVAQRAKTTFKYLRSLPKMFLQLGMGGLSCLGMFANASSGVEVFGVAAAPQRLSFALSSTRLSELDPEDTILDALEKLMQIVLKNPTNQLHGEGMASGGSSLTCVCVFAAKSAVLSR